MKRWRIDGCVRGRLVPAALFLVLAAAGWVAELRAESGTQVTSTLSPESLKRLGDTIRSEIASRKIPGGILLIKQHGKPLIFECFGVRDPDTELPMTPETIFQIYSMSKAVTSVAAMMLVDEGKLGLDDSASKYIHSFENAKVGVDLSDEAGKQPLKLEPLKRPITIRDLLRHTSGITYGFYGETQVRKLYANPLLYVGDYDNADSPIGSRCCRSPTNPRRDGTTAIQQTCWAGSSRWLRGRRCINSKNRDCSIRSACPTPPIMLLTK